MGPSERKARQLAAERGWSGPNAQRLFEAAALWDKNSTPELRRLVAEERSDAS